MKINAFEGGRRVSLFLKVVWILACIVLVHTRKPFVPLNYETQGPSAPFTMTTEDCGAQDAQEYRSSYKLEDDEEVYVTLCFKARRFPNGAVLVPYREEGGQLWGHEQYSSEVMGYTQGRAANFTLTGETLKAARQEWRRKRWGIIWTGLEAAVGGLIAITVITAVIGWIVRGFLGIPRGKDSRPDSPREPGQGSASA
jgi:hypothetical protein